MQNIIKINEAPSKDYLEMIFTKETATGRGLNNRFVMENLGDGTFKVTEGRIGITIGCHKPKSFIRPIMEWDALYSKKLSLGYSLFTTVKQDKKTIKKKGLSLDGQHFKALADKAVSTIVERLVGLANKVMEQEYTVKVENISDEMLEKGEELLKELACGYEKMSVPEFNNKLKVLYAVVPRRIDNLSKHLATRQIDFRDIVAREQELYDIVKSQVKGYSMEKSEDKTILDAYGLEWREVTDKEKEYLVKKLGNEGSRYIRAWKIKNHATEERFEEFCKSEKITEENGGIERLFHGSRSENFWSIITTGLTINPTGVVITGKMFGNGTYFAPDACKSMGYTDRSGSRWARGSSATGFLGVYKVAVGNAVSPSGVSKYNYSTLKSSGYHSVWCKRGGQIGLRMDEVVVYNDCQDTIEYLIEVGM